MHCDAFGQAGIGACVGVGHAQVHLAQCAVNVCLYTIISIANAYCLHVTGGRPMGDAC